MNYLEQLETLFSQYKEVKEKLGKLPGGYYAFSVKHKGYSNANLTKWRAPFKTEIEKANTDANYEPFKKFEELSFVIKCKKWLDDANSYINEHEKNHLVNRTVDFLHYFLPINPQKHKSSIEIGTIKMFSENKCKVTKRDFHHGGMMEYKGTYKAIDSKNTFSFNVSAENSSRFLNMICKISKEEDDQNLSPEFATSTAGVYSQYDGTRIQCGRIILGSQKLLAHNLFTSKHKFGINILWELLSPRSNNYIVATNELSDIVASNDIESKFVDANLPIISILDDIPTLNKLKINGIRERASSRVYSRPEYSPYDIVSKKHEQPNEHFDYLNSQYIETFDSLKEEFPKFQWKFVPMRPDFIRLAKQSSAMIFLYTGYGNLKMMMTCFGYALSESKHIYFVYKKGTLDKNTRTQLKNFGQSSSRIFSIQLDEFTDFNSKDIVLFIRSFIKINFKIVD